MYKVEKIGKGNIAARIVADSINENKSRITTFELEYPRFIHSELMTHRLFSRNAMSSRAVPIDKMIEQVINSPATPVHWGLNKAGMQASQEHENPVLCEDTWKSVAHTATLMAEMLKSKGLHKQIVNRVLEPFQMMKTVLTATEFENFFWLRLDEDAQPEIYELAKVMKNAYDASTPELLGIGEWHTPYVDHQRGRIDGNLHYIVRKDSDNSVYVNVDEAIAISSSCCAQVSYRNIDNSFDKAMKVYERLGVGGSKIHASPFEHVATPMKNIYKWDSDKPWVDGVNIADPDSWQEGITHRDKKGNLWSGNFKGWVQHRQLLKEHSKW